MVNVVWILLFSMRGLYLLVVSQKEYCVAFCESGLLCERTYVLHRHVIGRGV